LIFYKGQIALDEPSIVAIDTKTGDLIAVGYEALHMEGKEHQGITTIRPLSSCVIADFDAFEKMITGFIHKMGGGSTEIAAIYLGCIASVESVRIAGNQFTYDVIDYMARQYNIRVGFISAESVILFILLTFFY
jgi:actin-like ATPase involved in cell morphogenesis